MTDPASALERMDTAVSSEERRETADAAVDQVTESHQAAEGTSVTPSLSSRDGLKDALLRTSPEIPLERVESPWNPEEGGITRIYRGLQKLLDFEGTPAVVDLVVGAAEFVVAFEPAGGESEGQDQEPEPTGDETVPLSEVGTA